MLEMILLWLPNKDMIKLRSRRNSSATHVVRLSWELSRSGEWTRCPREQLGLGRAWWLQSRIQSSSWTAGACTKCSAVCSSDSSLLSLVRHFLLASQEPLGWCFIADVWPHFQTWPQKLYMRHRSEHAAQLCMGWADLTGFRWYWKPSFKPFTGAVLPKWYLYEVHALYKLQSHLTDQPWIFFRGPSVFCQHPLLPKWEVQLGLHQLPRNQESKMFESC